MPRRPVKETLESLHMTLQRLEQNPDPGSDAASVTELKRILLNRIAELEVAMALEPADAENAKTPEPAEVVPPAAISEEEPLKGAMDSPPLDQLD